MSGLEGLGIVANVIAVVDLSLKVISWCSKYAQDVKSSHDGRARLLQAAIRLHYESEKVQELLKKKGTKLQASQRLAYAMGNSEIQLRELESQLLPKGNRSSLKWPLQKDKVESAIQHIEKSTETIIDMLQIDMAGLLVGIDDRAEAEEQRATIDQLPYISDAVWDSHAEEHNAVCLPSTRTSLLQEIGDWVKDTTQQSKTVFWLNGMAGTGKSTISRTVSRHLSRDGLLGATFFFKRGEADRGGISKLVPTIARQLAMNQPALRPYIHEAIRDDPTIISKAVRIQFKALIYEPLISSSGQYPSESSIAIVIDALDECDSETDIRLILSLFSTTKTVSHPRPRIFVTSRPDLPVRLGFQNVKGSYQDLILHDIPESVIKQDISIFFHHKMKLIREDWNASVEERRKLPEDWPGSEFIRLLTERAVPLFIFAATACRFISERQLGNPEKQLHRVLEYRAEGTAAQLDFTYRPVLTQLFSSNSSNTNECRVVLEFQRVVGTIINLLDPLSTSALSRLLDIDQDTIDSKLDLLHSVLDVPVSQDAPVRMLHLSLRDYLMSPDIREYQFWVDEKKSARNLVKDCLRVMETLQPDICRLKIPGTLRSTIKPEFINACIPPEVQYACSYWVNHQVIAGAGPEDVTTILRFLKQHLLHWIEVLSLLGKAFQITELIKTLRSYMADEPTGDGPELANFLNDAIRLVDVDIHTVDLSPLQIYCSILVMAPSNSIVRRIFALQLPAWVTLLCGQVSNWDSRLRTFGYDNYGGQEDDSMWFSPNSKSLYSISEDGRCHVWSCDTGECIHYSDLGQNPMTGLEALLYSDAEYGFRRRIVSPDGRLMAVEFWLPKTESSIAQIFDLATGQFLREISDLKSFRALAFARDSKRIWSCTYDGQVSVWDVATGNCVDRLDSSSVGIDFRLYKPYEINMRLSLKDPDVLLVWKQGSAHVWYLDTNKAADSLSIQWPREADSRILISPDGRLLVTPSSEDLSLVIWDLPGRKALWKLPMGRNETKIALFSPESTFLVTACSDNTIRVWDMRNGKCFRVLTSVGYSWIFCSSITVSPDLKYLISDSNRDGVWLWNINTGTCVKLNIGRAYRNVAFCFSPDSRVLASKTRKGTIQLWDWERLLEEAPEATSMVKDVSFSPNSSMIAALFVNGTVTIWDTATGAPLHNFSGPIASSRIAFSPDSLFVTTQISHGSVKVWNLHEPDFEWQVSGKHLKVWFSPDSQSIATTCFEAGYEIKIWVRGNGTFKPKHTLFSSEETRVFQVVFARDSKLVAATLASLNEIKIWDCDTGHLVRSLPFEGIVFILSLDVRPLTISSYSMIISFQNHIEVWDLDAGVCTSKKAIQLSAYMRRAYRHMASCTGTFAALITRQERLHIFDWSTGETLAECPFPDLELKDFDPESSIIRTDHGDFSLALESAHHQQASQIFGVEPEGEWIQWKGHRIFRLPSELRGKDIPMEVKAIPGDALGFTVVIGSSSRGVVIMRFSNEGGMLDNIISKT